MTALTPSVRRFRPRVEQLEDRVTPTASTPWKFLGPEPVMDGSTIFSGRVDVAIADPSDPNVVWVGTGAGSPNPAGGGGIWKTNNWLSEHPTWKQLTDAFPSISIFGKSLALFPRQSGNILFAAAQGPDGGILKSTDGGKNWQYLAENLFNGADFGAVVINPADQHNIYVAVRGGTVSRGGGLYESTDGGHHWTNITSTTIGTGFVTDVVIDPQDPSVLYIGFIGGANTGVYKSTNGGSSWTLMTLPVPSGFTPGQYIALAMAPSNNDCVYATVFDVNNSSADPQLQRFRTTNGGSDWELLTLPPDLHEPQGTESDFRFWHVVLGIDPNNPDIIYVNADEPALDVSIDGGSTWHHLPTVDDVVNMYFDADDNLMLVGDRGIHFSTATDPLHPEFMSKQGNTGNFLFHSFAVDPLDPSKIFGVAQDQLSGLQYTGDTTWNYATAGTEVGRFLINPVDDLFVYNLSFTEKKGFDVQRSVDGGQTWTPQTSGLILDDFGDSDSQTLFNAFALDPSNPRHIVLGGTQVFQTTDLTTNPSQPVDLAWSQVGTLPDNVGNVTAIAVAPGTGGQTMYAATSTGQFFVRTSQQDWTEMSTGLNPSTMNFTLAIAVDPNNTKRIFITTNGTGTNAGQVWMTTTGGSSWTSIAGDLPSNLNVLTMTALFGSKKGKITLFIGTARGVYASKDLGKHWTLLGQGLPNAPVTDMQLLPSNHKLFVATMGRGVWKLRVPTTLETGDALEGYLRRNRLFRTALGLFVYRQWISRPSSLPGGVGSAQEKTPPFAVAPCIRKGRWMAEKTPLPNHSSWNSETRG